MVDDNDPSLMIAFNVFLHRNCTGIWLVLGRVFAHKSGAYREYYGTCNMVNRDDRCWRTIHDYTTGARRVFYKPYELSLFSLCACG